MSPPVRDTVYGGTPRAPEPMASRRQFYDDGQFEALAREAGVPEEGLPLFAGSATRFRLARKK